MQSKIASLLISVFFFYGFVTPAFAVTSTLSKKAQKIHAAVELLGTGEQTRVAIKLKSGENVKGYISSATEETFTVSDLNTGVYQDVKYSDVAQMHGQNLTSGQKYVIATGILVALLLTIAWAAASS
jgi:hypothetical protein